MISMKIKFQEVHQVLDFVKLISNVDCDCDIQYGHIIVDAKSLLGVMNLAANRVVDLVIHDEDSAPAITGKLAAFAA